MSSSRYRDDRGDGGYLHRHPPAPRDYHHSTSNTSSHPYDSRPLSTSNPSSYHSQPYSGRYEASSSRGGRGYEDRGGGYPSIPNSTSYSSVSSRPYAGSSSKYDDRRERTSRDYSNEDRRRGEVVESRSGDSSRVRSPLHPSTSFSTSRGGGAEAHDLSAMEPGEVLPSPRTIPGALPPVSSTARGAVYPPGSGYDSRPSVVEPSKYGRETTSHGHPPPLPPSTTKAYSTSDRNGYRSTSHRDYSPGRTSTSAYPAAHSTSRGHSPSRHRTDSQSHSHPSSSRRPRSPESTRRRRSSSPPPRRSNLSHSQHSHSTKPQYPSHTSSRAYAPSTTRRGRSPSRSPRSRSSSISPPPTRTRRRRRGSSCSSASRSPTPPPPRTHPAQHRSTTTTTTTSHRSNTLSKTATSSRRSQQRRGRSVSRSPQSPTSDSSSRSSRSRSPRTARSGSKTNKYNNGNSTTSRSEKRARSPVSSGRTYDKKAKVGNNSNSVAEMPSNGSRYPVSTQSSVATATLRSPYPTTTTSSSSTRVPPPINPATVSASSQSPATFDRPFYPAQSQPVVASGLAGAPTGPRALRQPLPSQSSVVPSPSTNSNSHPSPFHNNNSTPGFNSPIPQNGMLLPHGPTKISVGVPTVPPKGPKGGGGGRVGFAPIKTTQVAGPPGSVTATTTAGTITNGSIVKGKDVRKFFPGESDEEEEKRRVAEEKKKKEEEDKLERTRDYGRYRREDRMDVDEAERYASSSRRGRDREVEINREREVEGRGGWLVRDSGDVPPPRVRPLHDNDDDPPSRPSSNARQFPPPPSGPRGAPTPPTRGSGITPPTGPASHARPPASYERPSIATSRNTFQPASTSSNNSIPPTVERKWGAPIRPTPIAQAVPPVAASAEPIETQPKTLPPPEEKGGWVRSKPVEPAVVEKKEAVVEPSPLPTPVTVEPSPAATPVPASNGTSKAPTPLHVPASTANEAVIAPRPPAPTELYERLVQVGEGTYGKVYKARNVETNRLVALKRIRMEAEKDGFPITAVREIKLLQNLRHPNVVDLIEMLVSKGHVYMVMEYMDHDLTGVLHHPTISFSPAHLKSLMKQFLEGLGFIHRRGVLHRDLKGSNILLGKTGELKIADFGLARFYAKGRNNDYTNRVITQWYKPPELLFGATVYGEEVDMWSAGCIFLELFARRPVFQGQDEIHQLEVIFKVTGTPAVETWPGLQDLPWYELVKPKTTIPSQLRTMFSKWITPAGLDLAEQLLSLDPAGRPTAAKALRLPYFTTEEPKPEVPDILSTVKGEWHEYESKKARRKARDDAA